MGFHLRFPEQPFSRACKIHTLQPKGFHASCAWPSHTGGKCPSSQFIPVASRLVLCHTFTENLVLRLLGICRNETAAAWLYPGRQSLSVLVRDIF